MRLLFRLKFYASFVWQENFFTNLGANLIHPTLTIHSFSPRHMEQFSAAKNCILSGVGRTRDTKIQNIKFRLLKIITFTCTLPNSLFPLVMFRPLQYAYRMELELKQAYKYKDAINTNLYNTHLLLIKIFGYIIYNNIKEK